MDFDVGVGGPETNPLQIPKDDCTTFYLFICQFACFLSVFPHRNVSTLGTETEPLYPQYLEFYLHMTCAR